MSRFLCRAGVFLFVLFEFPGAASAQHLFEARLADPTYRYIDWSYTFPRSAIVDLFYVGVTGSNEFNFGGGYGFKPSPAFFVAPLAYAVFADEGGQRGGKIAVLVGFEKNGWKASGFLAQFVRVSGDVPNYLVLDTLDATRAIGAHLELGVLSGFFHADHDWNTLVGPLVKWTDRHGFWGVSYRFGDDDELRGVRVFTLSKPKPA